MQKKVVYKITLIIIAVVIVASSLLMNLFTQVVPVVKYYGESMYPALENGQILVAGKLAEIESGDVIAFYYNNKILVRRVIALENQEVYIDYFGNVKVDGNELTEDYVTNQSLGQCNIEFPYDVPDDTYFVLGDNREMAMDSRLQEIGTVPEDRILGKLIFSLKPFGKIK